MIHDPVFLVVAVATVVLVSVGKGAFGGGLAMLGIPLLSLVGDPIDAAIIVAPLLCLMDACALGAFGPSTWSKPDLLWLIPALIGGIGLGAAVFALVDPRLVTLLIALITLGFTAHYFLRGGAAILAAWPLQPALALTAGIVAGFTTFVAHSGGPPMAMYLLRRGFDKTVFAGTSIALFTIGNALKLPPYLVLGWARPQALVAALVLAPAVPIGVWLGKHLHRRLPQRRLYGACYLLLGLAALKLLADSIRSLAAG